jgi:hypothetical protein
MLRDEYLKIMRDFDEKEVENKIKSTQSKKQLSQSKKIFEAQSSRVNHRLSKLITNRNK